MIATAYTDTSPSTTGSTVDTSSSMSYDYYDEYYEGLLYETPCLSTEVYLEILRLSIIIEKILGRFSRLIVQLLLTIKVSIEFVFT